MPTISNGDAVAKALRDTLVRVEEVHVRGMTGREETNVADTLQFLANAAAKIAYAVSRSCDINDSRDKDRTEFSPAGDRGTLTGAVNRLADAIHRQVETQDGRVRPANRVAA
jgi:hypothetical protein